MKVTVITCDGCGRHVEAEREVRTLVVDGEWCGDCRRGAEVDLDGVPFSDWPEWMSKATVRRVLELRDRQEEKLRKQVADAREMTKETKRELRKLRRRAADGLREDRLDVVLRDIASNASRVEA